MSLKDLFKKKTAAAPAQKKAAASGMQTAEPQLKSDQPLPSVNAKKAGNKIVKRTLLAFGGALVLYLLYYVNTAPSNAQAKAEKKETETAQKNAISGSLPALSAPDRPAPPAGVDKVADATPAKPSDDKVPPPASNAAPGGTPPPPPAGSAPAAAAGASQSGAGKAAINVKADDKQPKKEAPGPSLFMTVESGEAKVSAVVAGGGSGGTDAGGGLFGGGATANDGNGELAKTLQPTRTKAAQASMLGNRNFLLAKGAFLDCSLETEIDSTKPGMTSCILNRTVYSDNLKTVLLEAGSKITGQYQGAMRQGEARIFVLWTRIQTPNGVVIDLDSPGTSPLGASGHDGYVDTHFWERFGGAIMLSMIQDVGAAAAGGGGNSNSYQNTQAAGQNMATEALRNSINIPPTLYKNHGEHINIFVARDLSFGSVYALKGD